MARVHEITIWTRGVVKDKEGRDVANALTLAADKEGKFTQAFDNYVDLPDRVNVPLRKYARISDEEIEMRYDYENEKPEIVVVVDQAIVKGVNLLRGMERDGVLVVNTDRSPETILKFVPNSALLKTLVCVDADGISGKATVDFSGTEGGIDTAGLGAGIAAPLLGAVAKVTDLVKLENLAGIVKDVEGLRRGYEQAVVVSLNGGAKKEAA
ncbi:MAG TPA: 2-oxoacid:acceptor oxidoreductase family protein [Candidatus Sulfotelmatobacter sp.]|nr:2-oxoacid:acceptor oxidoreductase family protein [Candidatus Sulfotelmatobacter sp.]